MEQRITRKRVLTECREIICSRLKNFSKHLNGLEPAEGYEKPWRLELQKLRIIEDMIHALDSEPVAAVLADWQTQVMKEDEEGEPHPLEVAAG